MGDYYGTTDDGTDLYGSPGSFTDENGVPLQIGAGTNINLADGGATVFGGGAPSPDGGAAAGSGSWLSGLAGVGNAVTNIFRAVNGTPTPGQQLYRGSVPSGYTLNSQGQLVPYQGAGSSSNLTTLLILAVAIYLLVRK